MMSALSVAFLPVVYPNCCCGWNAWFCKAAFHPPHVRGRPVAVDTAHGGRSVLHRLGEHVLDERGLGVVAIDKDGKVSFRNVPQVGRVSHMSPWSIMRSIGNAATMG